MIVAATGHRPDKLGGYSDAIFDGLERLAKSSLICVGATHAISGMALGWDQAVAQAACDLRLPWTAAVPFKGQESRWPASSQERYKDLLERASRVEVVSEGSYSALKMDLRNQWMVNNCDTILALYNGSKGGTCNCIRYANMRKVRVINLWPDWCND